MCAVTFCLALVFSVTNCSIRTNFTWHNPGRQQIMSDVIYFVIFGSVLDAKADNTSLLILFRNLQTTSLVCLELTQSFFKVVSSKISFVWIFASIHCLCVFFSVTRFIICKSYQEIHHITHFQIVPSESLTQFQVKNLNHVLTDNLSSKFLCRSFHQWWKEVYKKQ